MKKFFLIIGFIVAVIFFTVVGFFIYNYWRIQRGDYVKWDNQWYTKEDLAKKFPPQVYEVESRNTPEEVYTAFRQALLDNDTEKALSYIVEKNREEYRLIFENNEKLNKYKKIPEENIIKRSENNSIGNFAYYYYIINEKNYEISFVKNRRGFWEIERI
jgi:hypothetical protein